MKDAARVLARILSLACHLRVTFLATCMNGVSLACNGGVFICVACPKKNSIFQKKTEVLLPVACVSLLFDLRVTARSCVVTCTPLGTCMSPRAQPERVP